MYRSLSDNTIATLFLNSCNLNRPTKVNSNGTPKHQIWYDFFSNATPKMTPTHQIWYSVNSVIPNLV